MFIAKFYSTTNLKGSSLRQAAGYPRDLKAILYWKKGHIVSPSKPIHSSFFPASRGESFTIKKILRSDDNLHPCNRDTAEHPFNIHFRLFSIFLE